MYCISISSVYVEKVVEHLSTYSYWKDEETADQYPTCCQSPQCPRHRLDGTVNHSKNSITT